MTAKIAPIAAKSGPPISAHRCRLGVAAIVLASGITCFSHRALADEGGVSFWVPGFFGSLAATPQQPGWSLANIYYHTSVSAGGDVARAREFTAQQGSGQRYRQRKSKFACQRHRRSWLCDPELCIRNAGAGRPGFGVPYWEPTVVVEHHAGRPIVGGTLTGPGGANIPFMRSDSFSDTTWGFGDLIPQFALRWNAGVNNFMTYITGDIPVGAYQSDRLSNLGIGHGAIDAGGGYTYFNPATGHEFSGVLGFTYNFKNTSTQYQNGVDMHFDWGASQFLTKQVQVGLVGYVYKEVGCDSGSGDRVGCFQSQVFGVGPQFGYVFPLSHDLQGYINIKGYGEFGNSARPAGWNTWLTFVISPAAAPPPPAHRMITK